jgi:hypothetical protein
MFADCRQLLWTLLIGLVALSTGCSSPESRFESFVAEFESSYGAAVTSGDKLLSVSTRFEKVDGIQANLTYSVRRTDASNQTADVKTQVTYQFHDGKWHFVRSFPLDEATLRELNRDRNRAEAVATFLSAASNF